MSAQLCLTNNPATSPIASRPATRVRSADELRRALRAPGASPIALDASALDRVLRLDRARDAIEVQAAMHWSALAGYLAAHGAELEPFTRAPGLPATIGQAVSENAPGPDGAPVGLHVAAMALVTPDGELRRVERGAHDGLFRLALGGQGIFGVLYSVTLRVDSLLQAASRAEPPVLLELGDQTEGSAPIHRAELFVPPLETEAFLAEVRSLAAEERFALHGIAVRRLHAESESVLRWATRQWAGIALQYRTRNTLGARVRAAEIGRRLAAAAIARGGSFPVAAAHDTGRDQLERCYPALRDFLAEKRRYDPSERLQNPWYRRISALLRHQSCETRWSSQRAAEL